MRDYFFFCMQESCLSVSYTRRLENHPRPAKSAGLQPLTWRAYAGIIEAQSYKNHPYTQTKPKHKITHTPDFVRKDKKILHSSFIFLIFVHKNPNIR